VTHDFSELPISDLQMQQVHISHEFPWFEATSASKRTNASYAKEHDDYEAKLLRQCPPQLWPHDSYRATCPRPILVDRRHLQRVDYIHVALKAAIIDIVQRWWTDEAARLPQRMPLKPDEEAHLKVRQGQALPHYSVSMPEHEAYDLKLTK
jgi:hypothetical protein